MSRCYYLYFLLWVLTRSAYAQTDKGIKIIGGTAPAGTERRIALVIGNKDYQHVRKLKNPLNDAADMARALKMLGFEVITLTNVNYPQLVAGLTQFNAKLTTSDVALLYYSGHGLSYGGKNYLLPVDADIQCMEQVEVYGLSLNRILSDIGARKVRNSFVFLDACRNLPDLQICDNANKDLTGQPGLAKPTNNPRGSMVVYATREGSTADDNVTGRNGLFTEELLRHLTTPNLGIRRILDLTKRGVETKSGNRQTPGRYDELDDEFVFVQQPLQPEKREPILPEAKKPAPVADLPVGPAMVFIKGGTFQMGSTVGGLFGVKPVHAVTVSDFMLGKYEVTVSEYMQFVEETNSHYPEWLEKGSKYHIETGTDSSYKARGYTGSRSQLPIVGVAWSDAVAYCSWLSKKANRTYRLPTEAEWEYAARGGSSSHGYTFSGGNDAATVGWSVENSGSKPHPVGGKAANELGLHDMSGNVDEWCRDWYDSDYYASSSSMNPTGPTTGTFRVIRGGNWHFSSQSCWSVSRGSVPPAPAYRKSYVGFRVVAQAQ